MLVTLSLILFNLCHDIVISKKNKRKYLLKQRKKEEKTCSGEIGQALNLLQNEINATEADKLKQMISSTFSFIVYLFVLPKKSVKSLQCHLFILSRRRLSTISNLTQANQAALNVVDDVTLINNIYF